MNHAELEKWNRHVATGDVLLLASRGPEASAIKAYQALRRGEPAKYTHVAVVIGPDKVVDAMPPGGVDFRRWTDMESQYDVDNCSVARNVQLASNQDALRLLLARATFYYKQPYKLSQIFLPAEKVKDQSGMVCSQFVALLLSELGISASAHRPLETLPIDIDKATRPPGDWRQFPLVEYGMYTKYRPKDGGADFLNDVLRTIELSPEQEQAAQAIVDRIHGSDRGFAEFMSSTDELLAKSQAEQRGLNDYLQTVRDDQYKFSCDMQEFEDLVVQQMQRLVSQEMGEDELSALFASIPGSPSPEGKAFNGATLLAQWRRLFIDYKKRDPLFMHGERHAANREKFCAFFRTQVEQLAEMAAAHATRFETLAMQWLDAIANPDKLTSELVRSMLGTCSLLQRGLRPFCGEGEPEVRKRIDGYEQIFGEFTQWLSSEDVNPIIAENAKKCLLAIQDLDFKRLVCLLLQSQLATIVTKLCTPGKSDPPQDVTLPDSAERGE